MISAFKLLLLPLFALVAEAKVSAAEVKAHWREVQQKIDSGLHLRPLPRFTELFRNTPQGQYFAMHKNDEPIQTSSIVV